MQKAVDWKIGRFSLWVQEKNKGLMFFNIKPLEFGAPGRIRTRDPLVRSQVLYPTELPARENVIMRDSDSSVKSFFEKIKKHGQKAIERGSQPNK